MVTKPVSEREVLDHAVKAVLDPFLRARRFQGSGRKFKRITETAVHFVSIDGFWFGGLFAVNIDVHLRCIPPIWHPAPIDVRKITPTSGHLGTRLITLHDERH